MYYLENYAMTLFIEIRFLLPSHIKIVDLWLFLFIRVLINKRDFLHCPVVVDFAKAFVMLYNDWESPYRLPPF
jgi:hypothetical protein